MAQPADGATDGLDGLRGKLELLLRLPPGNWGHAQFDALAQGAFATLSADGAFVTEADLSKLAVFRRAQARASALTPWLGADFNSDGRLTRDNVRLFKKLQSRRAGVAANDKIDARIEREVDAAFRADANGDGVLTFEEIAAAGPRQLVPDPPADLSLAMDRDGDRRISRDEFASAVARVFAEADINGDGVVSTQESNAFLAHVQRERQAREQVVRELRSAQARETAQRERVATLGSRCRVPALPPGTPVHFGRFVSGHALSNVALGETGDGPTTVAHLIIEPGVEKFALTLSATSPMIFRFEGAIERLERVILFAGGSVKGRFGGDGRRGVFTPAHVAASGVPRDRVSIVVDSECMPHPENDVRLAHRAFFDREPATFLAPGRDGATVSYPSAQLLPTREDATRFDTSMTGDARLIWRDAITPWTGGVIRFDLRELATTGSAWRHDFLAGDLGLAEAVASGVMEVTEWHVLQQDGAEARISASMMRQRLATTGEPRKRIAVGYRILRKMTLPPGLRQDPLRIELLLADGVPEPDGSSGELCLLREPTRARVTETPGCAPDWTPRR